ncbi:unnamed protein product [Darwinula stevensoni]|uniref:Thioredoxin domain-containing protein n=1 Tax=Darwinula stevensoni TaxID=69355 RepID=A0A7R8XFN9_9CRUS|nr:unnamed protein product [Darwinula stevensoni]CAG0890765.1 unnamed protein product [Darwinula stevensoni]
MRVEETLRIRLTIRGPREPRELSPQPPAGRCLDTPTKGTDRVWCLCRADAFFLWIPSRIKVVGLHVLSMVVAGPSKGNVEEVNDIKELKKILRTKKNILILFSKSSKDAQGVLKICEEVAETIYGSGSILHIDCGKAEVKKLCKKLKAEPDSILLKHFKDGEYHKDYDRQLTTSSMIQFMRDPTGDRPWEEESSAKDIKHLHNSQALTKVLEKEGKQKGVMVMFYAPWCGFCKKMKPDFAAAASELKGEAIMAAMDVTRPENSQASKLYNITAFPTLIYFELVSPLGRFMD